MHVTDVSNASRTMLFNIHTGDWDDELLQLFDVPRERAARGARVERGLRRVAPSLGLGQFPSPASPAISRPRSSARCAATPGMSKNTYGTGCFLLQNTGTHADARRRPSVTTVAWKIGGRTEYALEGSVFIGGAVVQWLRDGLGLIRPRRDRAARASVPDNGGVFLVPAFAGSGRAALGSVRARHDRRHHARHDRGAHRARRAREHRVPGRRSARRDDRRLRRRAEGTARRRRRREQQHVDAVSGRPAGRAGRPARP